MRKLKKAFSLVLVLVTCLGLTVPAFATGTVKVVENETQGVKITLNGFLREETHRYKCDLGILADSIELTIYVVADNSTVTVEALEGRKYADPVLQGKNRWASINFATDSPERVAYQDFLNNMESYAYDNGESWRWDTELKQFWDGNGPSWPLTGATTYTVSPTPPEEAEELGIYLDEWYGIAWMCESDYAKLVPLDNGQPQQPAGTTASPTNDKLEVNGNAADPTVYKIGDSNYFKIRDVAALLNGTEKQFAVGYDGSKNAVTATTGQGYDKQSGDLTGAPAGGSQTADPSNDAIYVNGEKIAVEVYKINGSNYFKLRDLGKALDFYVGWSADRGMYIETNKAYSE